MEAFVRMAREDIARCLCFGVCFGLFVLGWSWDFSLDKLKEYVLKNMVKSVVMVSLLVFFFKTYAPNVMRKVVNACQDPYKGILEAILGLEDTSMQKDVGKKEGEKAKKKGEKVLPGDEVYIKAVGLGLYITDQTYKGYALLSKSKAKSRFKVSFGHISCSKSILNNGVRLIKQTGSCAGKVLYASTGDWRYVCYDGVKGNTKQLFSVQDAADRRVLREDELKYNTPIVFQDCFVGSVMCECQCNFDSQCSYLCSQYENERDWFDKFNPNHCMVWEIEKAEPSR
jgi:hypothetical protein